MGINPLDILFHIANILILFVLLRLILYKPVRKFMVERSERIQKQVEEAAAAEKAMLEEKARYEKMIAETDENVRQMLKEGEKQALSNADKIINEAKLQADKILNDAKLQAQAETLKTMENIQDQIADVAVEIAGKILSREVKVEDNQEFVSEFFKQLKVQ